ncbi:DgyrCDS8594 [Dimorphilus gyrociliatus]|uniref:DgyrCDS8594 n=1 Tax=Dimorphilus gyrociliatus TaxID=2664684 RepID=A0A7I8VUV2_9ANNE|nr:DgyrCDS8594 [Dimorphilus gyrociliatus]
MKAVILFTLSTLVALASSEMSCFKCNSTTDSWCLEGKPPSNTDDAYKCVAKYACTKSQLQNSNYTHVTRGCADVRQLRSYCEYYKASGGAKLINCECIQPLCNTAPVVNWSIWLLVPLLISLIFRFK